MKKLLGLLVSSMLVVSMVGCGADEVAEDAYEEAKDKVEEQTEPVEEPKDEYVEPEEVIEEPEVTKEELTISKEEVAQLLNEIIGDTMGVNYEVAVTITDSGDCAIGIADRNNAYSMYDKSVLESMCKEAGLEDSAMEIVRNAKLVFEEYDFNDVDVTLILTGNDYVPFMMVSDTGYISYN